MFQIILKQSFKKKNVGKSPAIEKLRFCNFKLRTILEITQAINQNQDNSYLLNFYKDIIVNKLNIGRFVLISNMISAWDIVLYEGIDLYDIVNIDIEKDLFPIKDIEITIGADAKITNIDFIIPIFKDEEVIAYVLMGDVNNEEIGLSPSIAHLQFIQSLTNIIMVAIQNRELLKKSLEQERLKKELETAAQIQSSLIPSQKNYPKFENIKIQNFYLPHFEVGGDLYDIGQINDHEFYFCIADVSGKGISAAMIMSNFQANLRAQFKINSKLEDIVTNLNSTVVELTEGFRFVTMFIAKYNVVKHTLIYVNAGHINPIVYDYDDKKITFLDKGCQGIGMLDVIPKIEIGKIKIKSRVKILCLTDGITEYSDINIEDYGYFVAQEAMLRDDLDIKQTIDFIVEKLQLSKSNPKVFDDVSIVGIELTPQSTLATLKKRFKNSNIESAI